MRAWFLTILMGWLWLPKVVLAQSPACSVSVSPTSVTQGENVRLVFTVRNSGEGNLTWAHLAAPELSGYNVTYSESGFGWGISWETNSAVYSGTMLTPGQSTELSVDLVPAGDAPGSMKWQAETSVDGGTNITGCGEVEIGVRPPVILPKITNLVLAVGTDQATISWNTDLSTNSEVNYGESDGYGSVKTESDLKTSHSLTITGLKSQTLYHFRLKVTDGSNNQSQTSDNTFTTNAPGVPRVVVTTVTNTVTSTTTTYVTPTATPTPIPDRTPPKVWLNTDMSIPYKEAPEIEGKISDNKDIASAEFSVDGGKNWLPLGIKIDKTGNLAAIKFTPEGLDDGSYEVKVKATDQSGNVGYSKKNKLVIDRLPPTVGMVLFSFGPQIIQENVLGKVFALEGSEIKITLSEAGGPEKVEMAYGDEKIEMRKNTENGLWSGKLRVKSSEHKDLIITSVDGANNITKRNVGAVMPISFGKIQSEDGKPLENAKIKVFVYETDEGIYEEWDSGAYLQSNPMELKADGNYGLFLPAGKYFMEISAKAKRKIRTNIFEVKEPVTINSSFALESGNWWNRWWPKMVKINLTEGQGQNETTELRGKLAPEFELTSSEGIFNNISLLGKPSVMSFLADWEPRTADQIAELEKFQKESNQVNVFPLMVQSSTSKTEIYQKLGGYQVNLLSDSDGLMVNSFGIYGSPSHVFLDRKGIIKDIKTGYLTQEEIQKTLNN